MGKGMDKRRWKYLTAFIIIFMIEACIAVFVHDRFIRPYVGDALVVVLIYCFVRIILPGGVRGLPLYVFLFTVLVEILQYFNLVDMLGLGGSRIARIILGSVFDWKDIASYGAGGLALQLMERYRRGMNGKRG